MKSKVLLVIALMMTASAGAWAETPASSAHSGWETDDIVMLRGEMYKLESAFAELDGYLSQKPPAYKEILDTLDRMEGIAKLIQKVNANPKLAPTFKHLFNNIKDLRSEAKSHHPTGMENSMNSLFENCFGCHLTHSTPRPAKKLPEKP